MTAQYKKLASIWFICLIFFISIFSQTDYKSDSNDSKFYIDLVRQISEGPSHLWLAPKWEGHYGHPKDKYIRDHFLGHILPGVFLAKLGMPYHGTLHFLNLFYQIGIFWLLFLISRFFFKDKQMALVQLWLSQFVYIGLVYALRANHEQAMTFYILLGLFSVLKTRESWSYVLLLFLSVQMVLLIKGVIILFCLPFYFFAAYLVHCQNWKGYSSILLAYLGLILTVYIYDQLYLSQTGLDFFKEYWKVQILERSVEGQVAFSPLQKIKNLSYYFSRALIYTAPLSLIALYQLIKNKKIKDLEEKKALLLFLFSGLCFIGAFSISDRVASRYIFPSFYLLTGAFCHYLIQVAKPIKDFNSWLLKRPKNLLIIILIWLVLTFGHLLHFVVKY